MKLKTEQIKQMISCLGYTAQDGEKEIYYKSYQNHNGYTISINFESEKIQYRSESISQEDGIKLGDDTTSNFKNSENFVVLECVNRLLEKGYPPNAICLEYKWLLGRKEKGKLDILVFDNDNKAYLMIECKTWGTEFEKEKKKMIRDGGQLFSYYVQNKAAQYLCLYTSHYSTNKINYVNEIVKVDELWHELDDQKEIHMHWNKNFKDNGIFNDWASAYGVEIKAITRGQLKELTSEDSGRIFNQFAEILRHNVVSDKPNAFNKILNLFICKIIDEDKKDDEEVDFQWKEDDTHEKLQARLNDLYKEGMKQFLDIDVTDYTDDELKSQLYDIGNPQVLNRIKEMFMHLRLQKNPEFAFKEVYNEQSFEDNAIVVKEVVELLQAYQFRYGHKQQFLGDFFELLLNTSIKQEAGQFFTPIPIAKFIVSSMPVKEFIENKINNNSGEFLPVVIDYAAGSGHFLTEWMDEVQSIIESFDLTSLRRQARKKFKVWQTDKFDWAKDYVYGIEADYRLVKTAKVSSFLNGDGEACIIRANGLDSFNKSIDYKGKLKEVSKDNSKDNGKFDVLIANPPYSVSSFKNTVQDGEESFELFNRLTENSSEIECLFVERAKQLLSEGGWAGIILPSSILNNTGIYTSTREIILKYFNIKAIVEFGSNTFMATGTNTVALFLERRRNIDNVKIHSRIKLFFDRPKDATIMGIQKSFTKYVNALYEDISLEDYISLVNKKPNDKIKKQEFYKEYVNWFSNLSEIKNLKTKKIFKQLSTKERQEKLNRIFYNKVFEKEKEKILYFLLAYKQKTVIIKVGEKKAEKEFLGYEFSNRRGHEGIRIYADEQGNQLTKLFDNKNRLNEKKANSYIYKAFLNEPISINDELKDNISVLNTIDLIDFSKLQFEKIISLIPKKKLSLKSNYPLRRLGEICDVRDGTHDSPQYKQNGYPLITSKNITSGYLDFTDVRLISEEDFNKINKRSLVEKNDILFAMIGTVGSPVIVDTDKKFAIKNVALFKFHNNTTLLNKYLKEILDYNIVKKQINFLQKGSNRTFVSLKILRNLLIPLPPINIQERVVHEISLLEDNEKHIKDQINKLSLKLMEPQYYNYPEVKLERISNMICRGKSARYGNSKIQIIKSGQARGYKQFDFTTKHYVTDKFISDNRNLVKGDILINSTGVGTAGRVTLFDLDGNYVVDSHITIVRLDKTIALPDYILYALANIGFKTIENMATGQSGQIELSLMIINNIKVPLPPIDQQKKIVKEINTIENKITELKSSIADTESKKNMVLKKYLE